MKKIVDNSLYTEIKAILEHARSGAYRAINFSMVLAYWEIGKKIVDGEQTGNSKAAYGAGLLKELSRRLTVDLARDIRKPILNIFVNST